MKNFIREFKPILLLFSVWRLATFLVAYLATTIIPRWGGRFPYADTVLIPTGLPSWIWGFGNFDGVHYLKIAREGYAAANSQAFFPLFPFLVKFFNILPKNPLFDPAIFVDPSYFYVAIVLSNIFLLAALYFLYRLIRLDFDKKTSFRALILLLVFPTSFYFGAVYTESLFLLLAALSIYETRKKNYLLGGVFAALASIARIMGLALFLLMLVEIFKERRSLKAFFGLLIAPLGALAYMIYLKITKGDFFYFLTAQPGFGAQRSAAPFILLPQVIYRYLKIFFTVPPASIEYLNAVLEFVFALGPILLLILFWKKLRMSYWLFTLAVLILPTLTGTFSSMPRYALMGFLLLPLIVTKLGKYFVSVSIFLALVGAILVALFTRGYWVA